MNVPDNEKYRKALHVLARLQSAGFEAYFAGGCVRDMIMGRPPKDYDIATNTPPDEIERLLHPTIAVGKAFGVIVALRGEDQFEVASFRWDGPYRDGRHPEVTKLSTKEDDIARRDFTVNGLFFNPATGEVLDLVGGRADIERRLIRAIGDPVERFREDRLRMMRAIRFACQLGFAIEDNTLAGVKAMAKAIVSVSNERIADELRHILVSNERRKGIELLDETGILAVLMPDVVAMKGVPQPPQFHPEGDVFEHTLLCLQHLDNPSWPLALAALLHDIGKPPTMQKLDRIRFHEHETVGVRMARRICAKLKLSNDERDTVLWLIERHMVFKDVQNMRQATLKRLFAHPLYKQLEELHRADKLACDGDMSTLQFCRAKYAEYGVEEIKPKPLLTGHDLLALGLEPGPVFGKVLRAVEDAQLDGEVKTREEAIALASKLAAESQPN
ncbi:MAG: CCA tRNA nucleotidyltransferase [Planctomycetota bacterium]|nr:CCA tRNA nucleotidyltransferase [Planctomycetota bacterium]